MRRTGELTLAYSGRALAPLPHPPRASTKTKAAYLMWGRSGFWALKVEPCWFKQKAPQDEPAGLRPGPTSPKTFQPCPANDLLITKQRFLTRPMGYESIALFHHRRQEKSRRFRA
jgi:hypothetical protein